MPAAIPEEDLLIPRSDDENSWAEYELSSVHVHAPSSESFNTPVNLLHASRGNPLTVTGQLEPLDPSDSDLLIPGAKLTNKRVNLELTDVCTFSYGELGDGTVAIWAGGKSGWFNIKPGRVYRSIFEEMQEAVKLLYFVSDSYKETRKEKRVGRGKKAMVLPPYSALELAEKYAAEFLGTDDADDAFEKFAEHKEFLIGAMIEGKEGLDWSTYSLWTDMKSRFPETFEEVKKRLKAKPVKTKAKKPVAKETVSEAKSSQSKSGRLGKEERDSTATSSTTTATVKHRGRTRKNAGAADVVSLSGSESSEEVRDTLVQAASDEPEDPPKAKTKSKSRRTRHNNIETTPLQATATPAKDDDDSDDDAYIRNKSSLRPRASKGNKGGKGRPREAEDVDSPPSSPTQGGEKRKYSQANSQRPHKRRSSDLDDDGDAEEEDADDDEGNDIPTSPGDPQNNVPDNPDPVQENTWICALAGCTHKVYLSDQPASQKLIREHYALHAYDDDARVRMVKKLAQPSLPIGHLMEKVRGQARMEGFPNSTVAVSRYGDGVTQNY